MTVISDTVANNAERRVVRSLAGRAASDGDGVHLTRIIGGPELPEFDPFLLLDEFGSDDPGAYIGGFPSHPHRGFETVTYMLAGRMRHRDDKGNEGLLKPGSVQWMTAGRGIVHSEMPEQTEGLMRGFQLWINLPARLKMSAPRYQDLQPDVIPEVAVDGGRVRVLAGRFADIAGPVDAEATAPLYLDVALSANGVISVDIPVGHSAFVYPYENDISIAGESVPAKRLALLGPGDRVTLTAVGAPAKAIVVAGRPLGEPVARYGPFVMNTQAEIRQAIDDFRAGRF